MQRPTEATNRTEREEEEEVVGREKKKEEEDKPTPRRRKKDEKRREREERKEKRKKGRKRELYKLRRNLTVPTAPELFSSGVEDCGGGALDGGRKNVKIFCRC